MEEERLQLAVFIDFDNIEIGVKTTLNNELDLALVLDALRERPGETRDGHRIALTANVGLVSDLRLIEQHGADGIGLFRTELLVLAHRGFPEEEEQAQLYTQVTRSLAPRSRSLVATARKTVICARSPISVRGPSICGPSASARCTCSSPCGSSARS